MPIQNDVPTQLKRWAIRLPRYKQVLLGGLSIFIIASLFPPVREYASYLKIYKIGGFEFIGSMSGSQIVNWSLLAVEWIAIVVITSVIAFVVHEPKK